MRYDNPDLIEELAAAYVLGTLRGPARRRLQRLSLERPPVRDAIWRWEQKLLPMAATAPAQTPSPRVWQNIEERLGLRGTPAPRERGFGWGRALAGFATGVITLALILPLLPEDGPVDSAAERLALIQDAQAQPLWVVTVDEESGQLTSVAVNAPARDADRVFELWMLPQEGAPQSFGLLPASEDGRGYRRLSPALLALLADAKGLAVSIEPPGGSPTGAPTGPVVYTAPVIGI